MYYLYLLYSPSSNKYYVGYTNDYIRRLEEHNYQDYFNTYTSKHRPWIIKAVFEVGYEVAFAVKVERFIKKQKSKKFIERIISDDFIGEGLLTQLIRVPYIRD